MLSRVAEHRGLGSSQWVSTTQQTKGSRMFFPKQVFFSLIKPTRGCFGRFLVWCCPQTLQNNPAAPCPSLQHSWLSSCPGCQRTNDPGSRAEQAPRQHRAAGKESKVWDHRSTAPRAAANSHRDTDWVTLGLLCRAACPTAAWYILVLPRQELTHPCQARDFFLKYFLFQQRLHNRVKKCR